MITKVGYNNMSFKGTYLQEDEAAKRVMSPDRSYFYGGKLQPFPNGNFTWYNDIIKEYSEKAHCDVVYSFKDTGEDTFIAHADIYEKDDKEKPFASCEEDISDCRKDSRKEPLVELYTSIIRAISQRRKETNIYID